MPNDSISNYGGKIPPTTANIKQFIISPINNAVSWVLKKVGLSKYITPSIDFAYIYINNLTSEKIDSQEITVTTLKVSDISLKANTQNIQNIDKDDYDKILNITPKKYDFIDNEKNNITKFGLIIEEIDNSFPQLVNNDMKTINYLELIPILICKIQDLQQQITALKK